MSSCIIICDPLAKKSEQLNNIDLNSSVQTLKDIVSKLTGISQNLQDLVYLGECLNEVDRPLVSYGIEDHVTLYLLNKPLRAKEDEVILHSVSEDEVVQLLSKAKNPLYRQSIRKYLRNKEHVEKVISDNPVLANDPVISSLLRDSNLLISIIDTATADSIVKEYPLLALALQIIIPKASATPIARSTLLQTNDNDEFEEIDLGNLAQAELLASNMGQQQQQQQSSDQRQQISAMDLANALSYASMTPPQTQGTPQVNTVSEEQITAALDQMRSVGITDSVVARRALTVTGGSVEAAINLIFEGTIS